MATGDLIRSFPAPATDSHGVLWDGSRLWVTDDDTDKLYQIDPSDGSVISSVDLPTVIEAPRPRGMGWDGSHIWYADNTISSGDETINKIKTDGTLVDSIPAPQFVPSGVTWAGDDLWIGDTNTDALYRVNPSDGTVLEVVDLNDFLGSAVNVKGLTYADGRLWVTSDSGDKLHKMTEAVDGVDETIDLSGIVADPKGISYDSSGIFWVATLSTIYALEAPEAGPTTPQQKFNASYADASAADPKATALIRPADVQRSIDTDVDNLAGGPNLYVVEAIFDIGELQNLNPYNPTTEKPRVFFVKDDQPGLRQGKNLLLKGYTIRDADPAVPVTCTFWG